jgi:uncharacterized protein YbjT (DUF2867 family)
MSDRTTLFVTGATGYIGGRLVPRLLERGYRVRALTRSAGKLAARPWGDHAELEIVEGDAADEALLVRAMAGCAAGYYLVHSMMAAGSEYAARDRRLAEVFGRAAAAAGVERIVYLGGLGETGQKLSAHLRSRREVEEALRAGGVPVTVLRAAMIVGSGSASFEILRYLVERLPVMITPRWVSTPCQPIAVENVLHYLVACLEVPATVGETLDVGGADVQSYRELMGHMAEALGLRPRLVVPVPLLTPRLSSLWIHLVTPLSHRIARPLAEGLRNPVVCRDDRAARLMPQRLLSAREAIGAAVDAARTGRAETRWSDAGPVPGDPDWAGGTVFVDRREVHLRTGPAAVWRAACRLGGERGWGAADPLWRLRGALDRLVGGPGLRRGRRDPERLAYGDALDFWRVTALEHDRRLELRAEMRLPGEAVLELTVEPSELLHGGTRLVQTARFQPRGLLGLLYWAAVSPLHPFVFRSLLRAVQEGAEGTVEDDLPASPGGR